MKDNFSAQAKLYASFRPYYPDLLYDFLFQQVKNFNSTLDCATGNGQVAVALAKKFKEVYATDISEKQLAHATQLPNIIYKQEAAEQTSFADKYFDLITVAQAVHWFNFDKFYSEVKRMLKPDGIIAIIGYGLIRVNKAIDEWIDHFYWNIVGPYWDKERKYVDEEYTTIPFPFKEITAPVMYIEYKWNIDQFIGYLNTWSALQHFIRQRGYNPVTEELLQQLNNVWQDDIIQTVRFPLFVKAGHQ
ncbi:MAG TPA: class I SAM-dependent methyltransferase [Chitinophagaceae bacterium]|nr:class I SAM-dependent methyltransferase [Chitinophagaceae bacterium]